MGILRYQVTVARALENLKVQRTQKVHPIKNSGSTHMWIYQNIDSQFWNFLPLTNLLQLTPDCLFISNYFSTVLIIFMKVDGTIFSHFKWLPFQVKTQNLSLAHAVNVQFRVRHTSFLLPGNCVALAKWLHDSETELLIRCKTCLKYLIYCLVYSYL